MSGRNRNSNRSDRRSGKGGHSSSRNGGNRWESRSNHDHGHREYRSPHDKNSNYSHRTGKNRRDNHGFGEYGGDSRNFSGRSNRSHSNRSSSRNGNFSGRNDRYSNNGNESYSYRNNAGGFSEYADALQGQNGENGTEMIFGRNPVTEAIRSGRSIEKILVQDTSGGSVGRVIALANDNGIPVQMVGRQLIEHLSNGASHQGVAAQVSAHEYAEVDDILALAEERGEDPFIVILDGIEDPHNLGAIMRTAECAGAHGVIIQKRRAVGLTQTVAKASAGAIEYLPCAKVTNISRTIEELKEKNIWVYACDMDGARYNEQDLRGPIAIVIGAEGEGISENVKKKCDGVVSMPLLGHINSLNASNAASILMYEIRRQRDVK